MPLLDIAISQPCSCFRNNILPLRSDYHLQGEPAIGNVGRLGSASSFSWKTFSTRKKLDKPYNMERVQVWRGWLTVRAVATLEISTVTRRRSEGVQGIATKDVDSMRLNSPMVEPQSSSEDSTEVDERERLRRMRISKANKGNTPWNKGKKHSPETLQRIKERTKLAMQDPKVKMKLVNFGHAQTDATKVKIGVGVRLGWERRRERLMLQETCHYEWQNHIAVAARKGLLGETELQWDSYEVLDEQLEKEWLHSVELRRNMPRTKGSKRAPKSAEQRRKISAAISAKWADPGYRDRVCSALAKFHGISEGVQRKPRKKPSGDAHGQKSPKKKVEADNLSKSETRSQLQRVRLKRSKTPLYKDPLASSKLEMLKNIRAQRAATVDKKTEAISRAKLLISEAERAAETLEKAARNSPLARESLMESRMLIAEAIQFIESVEEEDPVSFENEDDLSEIKTMQEPHVFVNHREVNGAHCLSASDIEAKDFIINKFVLSDLVKANTPNSYNSSPLRTDEEHTQSISNGFHSPELNNTADDSSFTLNPTGVAEQAQLSSVNGQEFRPENAKATVKRGNIMKKWVRGRLVEVEEET